MYRYYKNISDTTQCDSNLSLYDLSKYCTCISKLHQNELLRKYMGMIIQQLFLFRCWTAINQCLFCTNINKLFSY